LPSWRARGAEKGKGAEAPVSRCGGVASSSRFAEHEAFGSEQVTPRVSVVPSAWRAAADFPSRAVVPARSAPHHHAAALEMQHRIVTAESAHQLAKTPHQPRDRALNRLLWSDIRRRREPLGIVGHHGQSPCPFLPSSVGRRPSVCRSVLVSTAQEYQETCHGSAVEVELHAPLEVRTNKLGCS